MAGEWITATIEEVSEKVAMGPFGSSIKVETFVPSGVPVISGWVKTNGRRLDDKMFVARVVGHSMEPKIPDGSYCVFRAKPEGSRQGKIVLVQHRGIEDPESGGQFTVKRYKSEKSSNPDGTWQHTKITLEPLNPAYQPIAIDPSDAESVTVVAEFLEVLA